MQSLWQRFEQHACIDPDRIAVHDRGVDYSYAEVSERALQFAGWLRKVEVQKGDRVALLLSNSIEYVVCYLGVLRANAVVVALNPETTAEELNYTLTDAAPAVVVVNRKASRTLHKALSIPTDKCKVFRQIVCVGEAADDFSECGSQVISLEDASCRLGDELPATCASDLAQIIYTSGTTGQPKGVVLSHRAVMANCDSIINYLELRAEDSVAVVLPFFYSYGNSLLFTHLAVGGRLVLASDFVFWNRVLDLIEQQQVTGFSGVPSTYALLLHKSDLRKRQFATLRYLTCAGGALAPAHVAELRQTLPQSQIFLMYGQTEATARLSTLMPEDLDRKPGSIGCGIDGVTLSVLDDAGDPIEPGEVGEIVADGANLMVGYWGDTDATKNALRPEGLRTGDLAHIDDDGFIYIVGRRNDLIKSGSYRISPQEIEDTIVELHDVAETAVVGKRDPVWGERPVAFVVPSGGPAPELAVQVMEHCRSRLARHKQPHEILMVNGLPKTSSGKTEEIRTARDIERPVGSGRGRKRVGRNCIAV